MFWFLTGVGVGFLLNMGLTKWHQAGQVIAASVTDLDEYRARRRLDATSPLG